MIVTGKLHYRSTMVGDLAQLDRLALDQSDDDPYPDGQAFEMQGRMERMELGEHAVV
jgi:hypothetical protein